MTLSLENSSFCELDETNLSETNGGGAILAAIGAGVVKGCTIAGAAVGLGPVGGAVLIGACVVAVGVGVYAAVNS